MGGTCETTCCGDEQNLEIQKNAYVEVITDHRNLSQHQRLRSQKNIQPQSSYKNLVTTQVTEGSKKTMKGLRNQSSIHLTEEFDSFDDYSDSDSGEEDIGLDQTNALKIMGQAIQQLQKGSALEKVMAKTLKGICQRSNF